MAENSKSLYNENELEQGSTSCGSPGNNDEETLKKTRNDNSGSQKTVGHTIDRTNSQFYQLYKPQLEELFSIKLRIKELGGQCVVGLGDEEYRLNILLKEKSIEGKSGRSTSWKKKHWNEDLIFHIAKPKVAAIVSFEGTLYMRKSENSGDVLIGKFPFKLKDVMKDSEAKIHFKSDKKKFTVSFTRIEIDYKAERDVRVRCPSSMCDDEANFCMQRRPIVQRQLKKLLSLSELHKLDNVPNIAVIGSGGGMRAVVGMCGAMNALKDLGVLDCAMYIAGVSGSAWYISTLYANGTESNPKTCHDTIKKGLENGPTGVKSILLSLIAKCTEHLSEGKSATFTNVFGSFVGDILLGKNRYPKWSEQTQKLRNADVPLPLLAGLQVLDEKTPIEDFHEWIEYSPYEVFMPKYGIGIDMRHFGSKFDRGFLIEELEEKPVPFLQGMCGSAYAKLLDVQIPSSKGKETSWFGSFWNILDTGMQIFDKMIIGRVSNWLYGIPMSNKAETAGGNSRQESVSNPLQNQQEMMLADAGTVFNSPYPLVLSPGRKVDLILSFDFSYELDGTCSGYKELQKAEEWAKNYGVRFPELHLQPNDQKEEVRIFESKNAPVIMHFLMINTDFKEFSEPDVRRNKGDTFGEFDIGTKYTLDKFQYSEMEFNRLSKLMEYNVKKKADKIHDCIKKISNPNK